MAAPYHTILSKLDRALVAYIISKGAGTAANVLPAKQSRSKTLPCTICYSENADEIGSNSATFTCRSAIMVKTVAPEEVGVVDGTARLASAARVGSTFDAFYTDVDSAGDKLGEDITTAARAAAVADPTNNADLAEITVLDVIIKGVGAGFDDDWAWVDTLNLEIVCCPANVS